MDFGPWMLDYKEAQGMLETLSLWGVQTFRDFAALPTTGVAERLGQEGIRLQQLASGKTERHLTLKQSPPIFEYSFELEYALAELEPLSFIFARLLNQLCASLDAHALATNELRVRMKLETGTSHERTLSLPSPMRDHKAFLKLLLLDTEMYPPQQAVVAVSIGGEPVKPRTLQNGLFTPQAPEPEKLELTLARLAKLVGPGNVGSPELVNTHRPDAFCLKRFVITTNQRKKKRGEVRRQRRRDAETGDGDAEKGRCGEGVMRTDRRGGGEAGTRGWGDEEKGKRGDGEGEEDSLGTTSSPLKDPVSPHPPISASLNPLDRFLRKPRPSPWSASRVFRPPLRAMVKEVAAIPLKSALGARVVVSMEK